MVSTGFVSVSIMSSITFGPNQLGGRPCIRGLRVRVTYVLELLAAGESEDSILEECPYLEREDIRACLLFAAGELCSRRAVRFL